MFSKFSRTKKLIIRIWAAIWFAFLMGAPNLFAETVGIASPDRLYEQAKKAYYPLMSAHGNKASPGQWKDGVDQFLAVYRNYPTHPKAYKALFSAAQLYEKRFKLFNDAYDAKQAVFYYQKTLTEFNPGKLSDDALFRQGTLYKDLGEYPQALQAFQAIVHDYSGGDQFQAAQKEIRENAALIPQQPAQANAPGKSDSGLLVKAIHYNAAPTGARIEVTATGPIQVSHKQLFNPDRIYFNLIGARISQDIDRDFDTQGPLLKRIRVSQFTPDTGRLVLDISAAKDLKVSTRSTQTGLVIVLKAQNEGPPVIAQSVPAKPRVEPKIIEPPPKAAKPKPVPQTKPASMAKPARRAKPVPMAKSEFAKSLPAKPKNGKNGIPLIVIDPGHGGKDLGAQGRNKLLEKDINLELSLRLRKVLVKNYRYRVLLTRKNDTFIPLEERGKFANKHHADLFISIHANAAKRRSAHGIETYYLGIGHSERAQETAARENGELVHSVQDDQVQQILASLISTTKINDSSWLAGSVQETLCHNLKKKYSKVKDLGVKEGPFYVLHDANMPSILVEVGFVTHRMEGERLRSKKYLDQLADSIANGIHEFLENKRSI